MNRRAIQTYGKWIAGVILVVWLIGQHRGTWFGDPVVDRFLSKRDGDVVVALIDAEAPPLNDQGEIVPGLGNS